jgi:hypothetical protein
MTKYILRGIHGNNFFWVKNRDVRTVFKVMNVHNKFKIPK